MDNGSGKDYENMSDDDFANQSVPDPVVEEVVTEEPLVAETKAEALVPETVEDPEIPESEATAGEAVEEDENEDLSDEEIAAGPKSVEAKAEPDTAKVETKTDESVIDYKAAYDSIMAPFQANGRKFTPENPEEAIRLMQMGANYAKKMESLKPNLKTMRMLDNHGLLSEEKVSFLIDLSKNDPGAIAKLLKEAKIDPLDLDTSDETTYRPGVHTVSDTEMAFHDSLTEVASTPEGKETVSHINTHWDKTSKEMVYKEPALLQIINQQRANGIYDQITAEIEQMKVFGKIAPNTPFIEAYRQAGDHLQSQGKLTAAQPQATAPTPAPTALETRTVARRQALPNGEKAKAASPAKASAKAASKEFNPFDMSDEEIMALPSPRG